MPSALAYMTRTASWPRLCKTVAAISLLFSSCVLAQTVSGGGVQNAKVQAAYADWRRLSQTEVNCVDQSLRGQRSSLWALIQRGIDPSDAAIAKVRAACRAQVRAPNSSMMAQSGSQALAAANESVAEKAGDKAAADKAATDRAAAEKAAAEKAAAEKAAAEKAAAKAAADKAAADKAAADKLASDKAAANKAAADKAAADKAAADQAAINFAKAETERAKADAINAQADAERPQQEAEKTAADAAWSVAAADSRMSFIYGLISSPICFGLGGVVFLWVQRRRRRADAPSEASAPDHGSRSTQSEFDRLVTAVIAEQNRRDGKEPAPSAAERGRRVDEAVLH